MSLRGRGVKFDDDLWCYGSDMSPFFSRDKIWPWLVAQFSPNGAQMVRPRYKSPRVIAREGNMFPEVVEIGEWERRCQFGVVIDRWWGRMEMARCWCRVRSWRRNYFRAVSNELEWQEVWSNVWAIDQLNKAEAPGGRT